MNKVKLGRGLGNLIEENEINQDHNEKVQYIHVDEIKPRVNQPRKYFDAKKIEELATSIKNYGVIQPIVVSKTHEGFKIIAGERRFQASLRLKLSTIPCIVRDYNPNRISELALIENIQRENLTSIEEAYAIQTLIDQYGYTHIEIAQKIGKSRSHITNLLGILNLPKDVIQLVLEKKISMGHARALSKLNDLEKIKSLAEKIIVDNMSVRELENKLRLSSHKNNIPTKYESFSLMGAKVKEMNVNNDSVEITFTSSSEIQKFLKIIDSHE